MMSTIAKPYQQICIVRLKAALAGLEATSVITGQTSPDKALRRSRSTIFPDAVGIGHYAIDFHPCMENSPARSHPETKNVRVKGVVQDKLILFKLL